MNLKFIVFIINYTLANISIQYHKRVAKFNSKNHHLNINRHSQSYELSLAQNKEKNLYYITLMISDKKIPVQFMIDTGSSLLWMPKKKCINKQKVQFCGKFIQEDDYGYLDGSIRGDIIVTNVYVNDNIANNNTIMMLTTHQDENVDSPIIGLSYSSNMFPTFLDKMKQNGLIEKNAFTINMKDQKIIFGLMDEDREIVSSQFTGYGEFIINIDWVKFNNINLSIKQLNALIDSGNTLISFPVMFKQTIIDILQDKNLDCKIRVEENKDFSQLYCQQNSIQNIGTLSIGIQNHEMILTDKDLLEFCSDDEDDNNSNQSDEEDLEFKGYCAMSLEFHQNFSQQTLILGDPFLRKYMATFNLDDKIIQFDISNDLIKEVETL